ncbi:hypothetical protein IWQ61_008277, partial [Dispira simplex]
SSQVSVQVTSCQNAYAPYTTTSTPIQKIVQALPHACEQNAPTPAKLIELVNQYYTVINRHPSQALNHADYRSLCDLFDQLCVNRAIIPQSIHVEPTFSHADEEPCSKLATATEPLPLPTNIQQQLVSLCDNWLRLARLTLHGNSIMACVTPAAGWDPHRPQFDFGDFQLLLTTLARLGKTQKAWKVLQTLDVQYPNYQRAAMGQFLTPWFAQLRLQGNLTEAQRLWGYARQRGIPVLGVVYNIYIQILAQGGQFLSALHVFKEMQEEGRQPSGLALSTLFTHTPVGRQPPVVPRRLVQTVADRVIHLPPARVRSIVTTNLLTLLSDIRDAQRLNALVNAHVLYPGALPQPMVFTALVRALIHCDRTSGVPVFYHTLKRQFPTWEFPAPLTVRFMEAFSKLGQTDQVQSLYQNVCSIAALKTLSTSDVARTLMALFMVEAYAEAVKLFNRWEPLSHSVLDDNQVYTLVLQALGKLYQDEEIRRLDAKLTPALSSAPVALAIALVNAWAELGAVDEIRRLNRILNEHPGLGSLTANHYHYWLHANLTTGELSTAYDIFRRMKTYKVPISPVDLVLLIRGFSHQHQPDDLNQLYLYARQGSPPGRPDSCWTDMVWLEFLEAYTTHRLDPVVKELLTFRKTYPQFQRSFPVVSYNRLLKILFRGGYVDELWDIHRENMAGLPEQGIPPNAATYVHLLDVAMKQPQRTDAAALDSLLGRALQILDPCDTAFLVKLAQVATFSKRFYLVRRVLEMLMQSSTKLTRVAALTTVKNIWDCVYLMGEQNPSAVTKEMAGGSKGKSTQSTRKMALESGGSSSSLSEWILMASPPNPFFSGELAPFTRQRAHARTLYYLVILQGYGVLPLLLTNISSSGHTFDRQYLEQEIETLFGKNQGSTAEALVAQLRTLDSWQHSLHQRYYLTVYIIVLTDYRDGYTRAMDICQALHQQCLTTEWKMLVTADPFTLTRLGFSSFIDGLLAWDQPDLIRQWLQWQMTTYGPTLGHAALAASYLHQMQDVRRYAMVRFALQKLYAVQVEPGSGEDHPPRVVIHDRRLPCPVVKANDEGELNGQPLVSMDRYTYALAVTTFAHVGWPSAYPWLQAMVASGFLPDMYLWVSLVTNSSATGDVTNVLYLHTLCSVVYHQLDLNACPEDWWRQLQKGHVSFEEIKGRVTQVQERKGEWTSLSLPPLSRVPIALFTALLQAYTRVQCGELAQRLWQDFTQQKGVPNQTLVSVALDMSIGLPDLAHVESVLTYTRCTHPMVWNTNNYTSLIEAYCRLGYYHRALQVLTEEMPPAGVLPDRKLVNNFYFIVQQNVGGDTIMPSEERLDVAQRLMVYVNTHFPNLVVWSTTPL